MNTQKHVDHKEKEPNVEVKKETLREDGFTNRDAIKAHCESIGIGAELFEALVKKNVANLNILAQLSAA